VKLPLNRKVVIAVVAAAVLSAAGGTYAATRGSDKASDRPAGLLAQRQAFLDDVAKRLKVSSADLTAALQGAFADRIDAAVAAGKLTKAQADAIKARMKAHGGLPFLGAPFLGPELGLTFGPGFGPVGPGLPPRLRRALPGMPRLGPRGLRRLILPRMVRPGFPGPFLAVPFLGPELAGGPFAVLHSAAAYLGLTDAQVRQRLAGGASLAKIATDQGKSVDGLETALKDAVHSQLGKLSAAFDARVDKLVHLSLPRPLVQKTGP